MQRFQYAHDIADHRAHEYINAEVRCAAGAVGRTARVGCIEKGLGPLLPLFDGLVTTPVADLSDRGRVDDTPVIAMGEFGRTPRVGTQDSIDGRDHWPAAGGSTGK